MARAAVIVLWLGLLGMVASLASGKDQADDYVIQHMTYANVLSLHIQLQAVQKTLISLNEKIGTVDIKIAALEERLNGFEDRVIELLNGNAERFTTPLTSSEETAIVTPPSTHHPHESTTFDDTDGPLVLRRVRREEIQGSDGFRVSVQFDATVPPSVILWDNMFRINDHSEIPVVKPGTVEFDTDHANVFLAYFLPDRLQALTLNLRDTPASMDIPSVVIELSQGDALALDNQHKIHLRYGVRVSGGETEAIRSLDISHNIMVKSKTEANVVDVFREGSDLAWVEVVEEDTTNDSNGFTTTRQVSLVFNSTEEDIEGRLNIYATVTFNCSHNCLVEELYGLFKSVPFYGKGHTNPFPEGFISFIDEDYVRRNGSQQYCFIGGPYDYEVCQVSCSAFSTERLSVNLRPADFCDLPGGFLMAPQGFFDSEWPTAKLVMGNITTEASCAYLCTAHSRSLDISRNITLHIVQLPVIDTTASRIMRVENGSASATCVAQGTFSPAVSMTVYVNVLGVIEEKHYAYEVTELSHNTTQAKLYVPASEADKLQRVRCEAEYRLPGSSFITKNIF